MKYEIHDLKIYLSVFHKPNQINKNTKTQYNPVVIKIMSSTAAPDCIISFGSEPCTACTACTTTTTTTTLYGKAIFGNNRSSSTASRPVQPDSTTPAADVRLFMPK